MSAMGELVKSERIKRGMTRLRVSEKGGISYSTLTAIEDGRARYIKSEQVAQLAAGLDPANAHALAERIWRTIEPDARHRKYIPLMGVNGDGEREPSNGHT